MFIHFIIFFRCRIGFSSRKLNVHSLKKIWVAEILLFDFCRCFEIFLTWKSKCSFTLCRIKKIYSPVCLILYLPVLWNFSVVNIGMFITCRWREKKMVAGLICHLFGYLCLFTGNYCIDDFLLGSLLLISLGLLFALFACRTAGCLGI